MYAKENNMDQDEEFRSEMKRVEENVLKQYVINKILTSVKLTEEEKKAFYEAQNLTSQNQKQLQLNIY